MLRRLRNPLSDSSREANARGSSPAPNQPSIRETTPEKSSNLNANHNPGDVFSLIYNTVTELDKVSQDLAVFPEDTTVDAAMMAREARASRNLLLLLENSFSNTANVLNKRLNFIESHLRSKHGCHCPSPGIYNGPVVETIPPGVNGFVFPPMALSRGNRSDLVLTVGSTVAITWNLNIPVNGYNVAAFASKLNPRTGWPTRPGAEELSIEENPVVQNMIYFDEVQTVGQVTTPWVVPKMGEDMPNNFWIRLELHWNVTKGEKQLDHSSFASAAFRLRYPDTETIQEANASEVTIQEPQLTQQLPMGE